MHYPFKIPPRKTPTFKSIAEFEKGRTLGNGAFASVIEAMHIQSKRKYAIKQVNLLKIAPVDYENVFKELEIHSRVSSPFLVKMFDFWKEGAMIHIVLELCPGGNLYRFMNTNNLSETEIRRFFVHATLGVKYLHSQGVIMRDLKPENIVLDARSNAKICDFGWAADLKDTAYCSIKAGTYAYMSPESLAGTLQNEKSDVWSLGIFLYELMYNKEPYQGNSCTSMLRAIKETQLEFPHKGLGGANQLIGELLKFGVKERPSLKFILTSQFFQDSLMHVDSAAFKREQTLTPVHVVPQTPKVPLAHLPVANHSTLVKSQAQSPLPNVFVRNTSQIFKPMNLGIAKPEVVAATPRAAPAPPATPGAVGESAATLAGQAQTQRPEKSKSEVKRPENPLFRPLNLQLPVSAQNSGFSAPQLPKQPPARELSEPHKLQPTVINSVRMTPADLKSFMGTSRPNPLMPTSVPTRDQKPFSMTPNVSSKPPIFTPLFKDPPAAMKRNVSENTFLTPHPERTILPAVRYMVQTPVLSNAQIEERKARRIDQLSHCSFVNDPGTQRTGQQPSASPSVTFTRHFSSQTPLTHHLQSGVSQPSPLPNSYQNSLLNLATQRVLPKASPAASHNDKKLSLSINENARPQNKHPDIPTERLITVFSQRDKLRPAEPERPTDHNIYASSKIGLASTPGPSVTKITRQKTLTEPEDNRTNIYSRGQKIVVVGKPETRKPDFKMSFGSSILVNRK